MHRTRRLRRTGLLRDLVAETRINRNMFVQPHFVVPGRNVVQPVDAMPGVARYSIDKLVERTGAGLRNGLSRVLLFGAGEEKSADAHTAYHERSVVAQAIAELKKEFGDDLLVITDVCLCAYTEDGHCGLSRTLDRGGHATQYVDNDTSLEPLARMALAHAHAGADMVAPSDMMDGRVEAIRRLLDENRFEHLPVMSYSAKFASAYYGPFREAAGSAPGHGDRKSYQMDPRNGREALRECRIDEEEGADIVMVKPALAYLDIIRAVKENTALPVACYNVSAEYSMVKAAAQAGYIDEEKIVMENMVAFSRAGADIIITYHAEDLFSKGWLERV